MWKYTRMVVLTALTAAIYVAVLIPLKGIQFIPGLAEFRPAGVGFGLVFFKKYGIIDLCFLVPPRLAFGERWGLIEGE